VDNKESASISQLAGATLSSARPQSGSKPRAAVELHLRGRHVPLLTELDLAVALATAETDSHCRWVLWPWYRSGNWKDALRRSIEIRQQQRRNGYMSAYSIGALYADLGNKDQAFRWLNIAYQERDVYLVGLPSDFLLDTLRSDPRFEELARKMGLPR
jgi:hypothetical protein